MFDLGPAIEEWRRQMAAGGIISPEALNELESHLRDTIEEHLRAGVGEPQVFDIAVRQLGHATALEREFEKVGTTNETPARLRDAFFVLAGVGHTNMNTPASTEPRWATYIKAAAFLGPALFLWLASAFFLLPKLQQICGDAGAHPMPGIVRVMMALTQNGLLIAGGLVALLVLLEWRVELFARYRRAVVGVGTFLVNGVVLVSIFMMVVAALLAAPGLLHHAR